ncbi:hypothetical protein B296_00018440, partial [Ensete ventricosum]
KQLALIPYCSKMGGVVGRSNSIRRSSPESKLEAKMVEAMQRRASEGTSVKSFNSIIMKFPKIDESLQKCKSIFEQFGELCKSRMGLPDLETTFETLVDAFVFLDKNKDGYVSKNEMVHAINETIGGERSSGRIAMKRFGQFFPLTCTQDQYCFFFWFAAEEMDWDKNGMVTFKEFLFAFTRWVGIDDVEDEE